jgi:type I restriction enzyme, S subunit
MKWEKGIVYDLCDINSENISRNYPHDFIRYYDITSVGSGIATVNDEIQLSKAPSRAKRIVRNNDSIIATVRPGNKSYYFFKATFENSFVSTGFAVLRPKENKADPRFLYYLISEPGFTAYLVAYEQGANYPAVNPDIIGNKPIEYPSFHTQRRIASILSAYDDLIENNLKRIKLLEEKANLDYKELQKEVSYSKAKREEYVKDCLAFYIGGGWGEEEYKEGFSEPAYVIRGTDIPDARRGEINGVPFRYHKESNLASRKLQAGDIVFEVSGGSKGQPVGRSLLITEKMLNQFVKPVMCASFCKMLRPNETVSPEFFYLYLLASHENGVISQYEKHSASNIVNYGFEEFIGEQIITIPKDPELKTFTEIIKPIFTLISTLGEQNNKLREARDILLPRLMNGELEVL